MVANWENNLKWSNFMKFSTDTSKVVARNLAFFVNANGILEDKIPTWGWRIKALAPACGAYGRQSATSFGGRLSERKPKHRGSPLDHRHTCVHKPANSNRGRALHKPE